MSVRGFSNRRLLGVAIVARFVLQGTAARGQGAPPAAHEDAAFDFMNLLAHKGLHDIGSESWNAYGQFTYISSWKLPFDALHTNLNGSPNSLLPTYERSFTGSFTLFFGLRLWEGGQFYLVPEVISELPLSNLHGIGGAIQNFELQKQGQIRPQLYRSRTYLRQTFDFGGAPVHQTSDPMQLAAVISSRRLVLTVGNFSILDVFDKNSVSWDPRQTFLNMAFMTYASWDFPADARGYTYGVTGELYWDNWVVRLARILPPQNPNAPTIDFRFWKFYGDEIELEHDHVIYGRPGAVRLLGYRNRVDAGVFTDAIAAFQADPAKNAAACEAAGLYNYNSQNAGAPDLCWVRRPNTKLGIGIDWEQYVTPDIGVFFRGMYSDGNSEVYAFNSADRSVAVGAVAKGASWRRPFDVTGIGVGMSWISASHAQYLAMGGVDGFIGDGFLRQAGEGILEVFYSYNLIKAVWLSGDYQHLWNPGYNADRGPVEILGARIHVEF